MLLTLILFFYAAFFYKPSLVEEKTKKIQITKSHLQAKNKPTKRPKNKEAASNFKVIRVAFSSFGALLIINSISINNLCYIFFLSYLKISYL